VNDQDRIDFHKHPAKLNAIKNTTTETARAPKLPFYKALALDDGNDEVLRSRQLIFACLVHLHSTTSE